MPKKPVKTAKTSKTARRAPARSAAKRNAPELTAADPMAIADQLAKATKLAREEVLRRALASFAASHGLSAPATVAEAAPVQPVAAPVAVAAAAPVEERKGPELKDDSHLPALAPPVRLYVHGNGRPPQEMIGDTYVIGSSNRCDLWVNMPKIETKHVRITRHGGTKYFLEDLGTDGGTFVDGQRITGPYEIKNEDSVFLAGYHRVRFYLLS